MATFNTDSNNSVVAVMTKEAYQEAERRWALVKECEKKGLPRPQLPSVTPIFTFSRVDHPSFKFMTGTFELMERLLKGHNVIRGGIWVPFSNGTEWMWSDVESTRHELEFCTTLDEALQAFGLIIPAEQKAETKMSMSIGANH